MQRDAAERLLRQTLEHKYGERSFRLLVANLLDDACIEPEKGPRSVHKAFADHIAYYKRIGRYTSPSGEPLDVLVVKLRRHSSLDRARTMQRNFVAHYLQNKRGRDVDTVLAAFYAADAGDWRLSFVEMSYTLTQDETTDNVTAQQSLTPARRYSFLVGEDEPCHTAQKQLAPLLVDDDSPSLAALEAAFDIDVVTREFFERYKALFLELKENLDALVDEHAAISDEFGAASIDTTTFAKKLLGQIVFLYFLQKKGWLGVEAVPSATWGSGPKDFLRRLFDGKYVAYGNFFNDALEPLFYEALATDRGADAYYKHFGCKIPFLNGGLFEPAGGYRWAAVDIPLDDSLFQRIFDAFDRYNFTVREDEPLEKEVAVDPEMLGKVFENLLEVTDRKSKGAFYTPREIVHYMCQASLIRYLDGTLNHRPTPLARVESQRDAFGRADQGSLEVEAYRPRVPRDALAAFVRAGESAAHNDRRVEQEGRETPTYSYRLPARIREHAGGIDEALANITICDPAVGSGAFPVGMMQEIVRARQTLSTYLPEDGERTAYAFKRHAILHSLYGVDIDAGAVDIARLRLWLSLVVDEDDFRTIQPLPNLRYKIVQGDALMGMERTLENNTAEDELHRMIDAHVEAAHPTKKQALQTRIDALIHELTDGGDRFAFHVYFGDVFRRRGGFDVVIGNPPYVRQETLTSDQKGYFKAKYEVYNGSADLYAYFIERGMAVLRKGGAFCYIVSNKWMRARYGKPLRKWLVRQHLVELIDFGDLPVFQGATAYPCILRMDKRPPESAFYATDVDALPFGKGRVNGAGGPDGLAAYVRAERFPVRQQALRPEGWALVDPPTRRLLEKLRRAGTPLGEYVEGKIYYGIKTGLNKAFVIDASTRERLIAEDASSGEIIKPFLAGRDVKRYRPPVAKKYVIVVPSGWTNAQMGEVEDQQGFSSHPQPNPGGGVQEEPAETAAWRWFEDRFPAVAAHMAQFERAARKRYDQGDYWWELRPCAYYEEFEKGKILLPDIAKASKVTLDAECGLYCANTAYIIGSASKYLLGLLNSRLLVFFYSHISSTYRGGYLRFIYQYLKQLPIRPLSPNNATDQSHRKQMETLVTRMLDLHSQEAEAAGASESLQKQIAETDRAIDRLVYELYDLNDEEIALVEKQN